MKQILMGNEARMRLKAGVDKVCDVVKVSLGGYGKNVAIFNGYTTEIINDGVTIAKEVNVKDEVEQAGIQLAKQCAEATNNSAGDGTTTTIVLLQSILNEIITPVQTENPRDLRERLFKETNEVLAKIEVKQINSPEDVYNLAYTSCLDGEVAGLIRDIYSELGKDTKITIEEKGFDVLDKEIVKGIKFESRKANILSNEGRESYENIPVMVIDKAVNSQEILTRANEVAKDTDKLLIVANVFDRNVLIGMEKSPNFKFIPVEFKELKNLDDLKAYCGDGMVDKVILDDDSCTLIGGKGDVEARIEVLRSKKEESGSEYDKEELDKRIASLKAGVAVIKVGKQTDVERVETVLKIEDAINCVKGAYEMGYCKGGGLALMEAGGSDAVYKQICINAGVDLVEIPDTVVDSFKSVKESLLNALSTATSILMVESALIETKDEEC